ncbi:IclR family transcriptional regulator [Anaerosalibacter bizertensis]|uniref:IclR family transcriptional regulator n=1 Tax=Anaerosalibacter bizertensis TaxID=932217 RepID=UPI003515B749
MGQNTSLKKAIMILKRLSKEPYEMSALDLSNELGLNRSTIHRILNSLIEEELVFQNSLSRKYSLGPVAYSIGMGYLNNNNKIDQIKNILEELAKNSQQSIGYAKLVGEKIMNVIEIEGYQVVKIGYKPGNFYPINCGVYGKTIMAFFKPYSRLEEIVYSYDFRKRGPNTIMNPNDLLKEYEEIRQKGYATSDGEVGKGIMGIGAPVRDLSGRVVGCVGVAYIKEALNEDETKELKQQIIKSADRVSQLIL